MSLELTNLNKFSASLRAVQAATKKTEAEIVNRAARDVAFRAMSFTEKTTAAAISADLKSKGPLLARLAAKKLRETQGAYSKEALKFMMKKIENARRSRASGFRAGWIPAILGMGGTVRGVKQKPNTSAKGGFGKRATVTRLSAHIRNTIVSVSSAGKITPAARISPLVSALNKAVAFVASDREKYVRRKMMGETLKQFSSK